MTDIHTIPPDREQNVSNLIASDAAVDFVGGDSYYDPSPFSDVAEADIESWVRDKVIQGETRERTRDQVDVQFDVKGLRDYRNQLIDRYRRHNYQLAASSPERQAEFGRPVTVDPEEHSRWEQMMAQWHQARIDAGFREGIFNDPELAKITQVLTADMGVGRPGYFVRGEPQYDPGYGPVGFIATEIVNPAVSSIWNLGFNFGYGAARLGAMAYSGLTGEDVDYTLPTSSIVDDNGNVIDNAGKLPTFNQTVTAALGTAFEDEVERKVNSVGLAEEYAVARRTGLTELIHSTRTPRS